MSLAQNLKKPVISYYGTINSDIETELITQVETYLESIKCKPAATTKIMTILVELLQNILHHSNTKDLAHEIIGDSFQLETDTAGFIISTTNFIKTTKVATLTKRIEYLNTLGKEELANLYKDILNNGDTVRETAGLGFIDIRRKSGTPILFKFDPPNLPDNKYSLFTVRVHVKK